MEYLSGLVSTPEWVRDVIKRRPLLLALWMEEGA